MRLATRCPSCTTMFLVVEDQLRVSDGWVRCGRCGSVFNALEDLVDVESGGAVELNLQALQAGQRATRVGTSGNGGAQAPQTAPATAVDPAAAQHTPFAASPPAAPSSLDGAPPPFGHPYATPPQPAATPEAPEAPATPMAEPWAGQDPLPPAAFGPASSPPDDRPDWRSGIAAPPPEMPEDHYPPRTAPSRPEPRWVAGWSDEAPAPQPAPAPAHTPAPPTPAPPAPAAPPLRPPLPPAPAPTPAPGASVWPQAPRGSSAYAPTAPTSPAAPVHSPLPVAPPPPAAPPPEPTADADFYPATEILDPRRQSLDQDPDDDWDSPGDFQPPPAAQPLRPRLDLRDAPHSGDDVPPNLLRAPSRPDAGPTPQPAPAFAAPPTAGAAAPAGFTGIYGRTGGTGRSGLTERPTDRPPEHGPSAMPDGPDTLPPEDDDFVPLAERPTEILDERPSVWGDSMWSPGDDLGDRDDDGGLPDPYRDRHPEHAPQRAGDPDGPRPAPHRYGPLDDSLEAESRPSGRALLRDDALPPPPEGGRRAPDPFDPFDPLDALDDGDHLDELRELDDIAQMAAARQRPPAPDFDDADTLPASTAPTPQVHSTRADAPRASDDADLTAGGNPAGLDGLEPPVPPLAPAASRRPFVDLSDTRPLNAPDLVPPPQVDPDQPLPPWRPVDDADDHGFGPPLAPVEPGAQAEPFASSAPTDRDDLDTDWPDDTPELASRPPLDEAIDPDAPAGAAWAHDPLGEDSEDAGHERPDQAHGTVRADAGPSVLPTFVRQADRAARWRTPQMRMKLAAASLVLLVLAGLQAALLWRDELAAHWPAALPWVGGVGGLFGLTVEPLRRIERFSVDSSALTRASDDAADDDGTAQRHRYLLTVRLRNHADVALMAPALELTLSDVRGEIVSRRVLSLADFDQPGNTLAAGQELQMRTGLDTGTQAVQGYTVELFYP